jgi:deoxyribodipyrimidine photolyase-related protein
MSYTAVLIFPNQLFEDLEPIVGKGKRIYYLIEEPLFFGDKERIENFNGLKLLMHRASMQIYRDYLISKGLEVQYIHYNKQEEFHTAVEGSKEVIYYDVVDHLLQSRLDNMFTNYKKKSTMLPTQLFICDLDELAEFIAGRAKNKRKYFQTDFYRWQRKRLNILIDENGEFEGGKLSFDQQNRESAPKEGFPKIKYHTTQKNKYIEEAQKYVLETFPDHYGNIENFGHIPFSTEDARTKLQIFLKNRLFNFGNYEDSIDTNNPFIYHSILSSALNIGIITPMEVVEEALDYYYTHPETIGINDIEGFVRQIVGWREYYRMVYMDLYDEMVNTNLLGHTREITDIWYTGNTGIKPVDDNIHIAFEYGYLHHIIRLMVIGQFMLLCEIHPDDMYKWFMEFAIDSYDWVMVPNVYGMVGYNDGGKTTTKPYISTANYIYKMSNYKKEKVDKSWDYIWRCMYYRFIHENMEALNNNPRTRRMVWQMNNMKPTELKVLLSDAEEYLAKLSN